MVENGQKIIIDFGFESLMSESERKSLSSQLLYSYGENKKTDKPLKIYLSDYKGDIKMRTEKMSGFHEWPIYCDSRPFYELFPKEQLVYFTADSPNVIDKLDKDKVYIIGGIVDRNRHKGLTYKRAQEYGIETARLNFDSDIKLISSRVLTVNHSIILLYYSDFNIN